MLNRISLLVLLILIAVPVAVYADSDQSTRIVDARQHAVSGGRGRYPYRQKSEYVLKELDRSLREADAQPETMRIKQ